MFCKRTTRNKSRDGTHGFMVLQWTKLWVDDPLPTVAGKETGEGLVFCEERCSGSFEIWNFQ